MEYNNRNSARPKNASDGPRSAMGRPSGASSRPKGAPPQRGSGRPGEVPHGSAQSQSAWVYPESGGGIYSSGNMNGVGMGRGGRSSRGAGQAYREDPNEASMRRIRANQARHREQLRRQREAEQKKARREAMKYNVILVMKIFAAVFAVCVVLTAGVYFAMFFGKSEHYPDVTYTYVDRTVKKVDSSVSYSGGVLYVNFSALSAELDMSVVGGANRMKFVFAADGVETDGGEFAEFHSGSARVTVNSQDTVCEAPALLRGESMWVPLSFISDYMKGIKAESDGKTVTLSLIEAEGSTKDKPLYEKVAFTLKDPSPLDRVDESNVPGGNTSAVEFISDLSSYEEYMNPAERDAYIALINPANTLQESYIPEDLTDIADTRKDDRAVQQMRLYAAKAMEAMFIEMRSAGYNDVSVTSAYRSYSRQKELFSSYTNQEMAKNPALTKEQAEAIVVTYSNRPGTSEHQSGLCADLHNLPAADRSFADQAAYAWLQENAWKFGFIERYPKDKTDVTGVSFEPWHYRFVGRYHALRMKQTGKCLEEYTETLN